MLVNWRRFAVAHSYFIHSHLPPYVCKPSTQFTIGNTSLLINQSFVTTAPFMVIVGLMAFTLSALV